MSLTPLRVPKTAELVAAELRRRIVEGELEEGDALPPELELRESFGVSRPTLREAFRVLESEGLIEVHRGARGGARVRVPTEAAAARYAGLVLEHRGATLADVCAVRTIIEPACASLVAARRDPADVQRLRALTTKAASHGETRVRAAAQNDFHTVLVELAGNRTLVLLHTIVQQIIDQALDRRITSTPSEDAVHQGGQAHLRVIELIEAGESERAARAWRRHIEETTEFLLRDGRSTMVLDLLP